MLFCGSGALYCLEGAPSAVCLFGAADVCVSRLVYLLAHGVLVCCGLAKLADRQRWARNLHLAQSICRAGALQFCSRQGDQRSATQVWPTATLESNWALARASFLQIWALACARTVSGPSCWRVRVLIGQFKTKCLAKVGGKLRVCSHRPWGRCIAAPLEAAPSCCRL